MGPIRKVRDKVIGTPENRAALRNARKALNANKDTTETPEFHRLTDAAYDAMDKVPPLGKGWW